MKICEVHITRAWPVYVIPIFHQMQELYYLHRDQVLVKQKAFFHMTQAFEKY